MIVNTKTGELKLTKRERDILQSAMNLLSQLEKHGGNSISLKAEDSVTALGALLEALLPVEAAA